MKELRGWMQSVYDSNHQVLTALGFGPFISQYNTGSKPIHDVDTGYFNATHRLKTYNRYTCAGYYRDVIEHVNRIIIGSALSPTIKHNTVYTDSFVSTV
jgi:hypothetical protein